VLQCCRLDTSAVFASFLSTPGARLPPSEFRIWNVTRCLYLLEVWTQDMKVADHMFLSLKNEN